MGKIQSETFVCIDCETTGLDTKNDRIIEVAVGTFTTSEVLEQFSTLVDPKCEIPQASIAIHNISPEMVKGQPSIESVLPRVLELISNKIIVGHGVEFDIDLLAVAAERGGISCTIRSNRVIDTLRLARHYGESKTNSLSQLCRHFNIVFDDAHRAMSDVLANIEVFKHLVRRYQRVEQLFEMLSKPIQLRSMPLGQHKGRPMKEVPIEYLRWAANKDFDQDLLYSIRTEINRRKKGNQFDRASNPFSDL